MSLQMAAPSRGPAYPQSKQVHHVRLGVSADIPELLAMGRELHAENAMMPLSEARIREAAARAIKQDRAMVGCIGPVGGILEGMIYLTIGQFWYTDKPHLEELYNFVRPEFRRSRRAESLVRFAMKSSERLHVPLLIGVISNWRTEAKVRMYQRLLGKPAGAFFLYNGKTGD
jgi:hypothetical protein